MNWLRIVIGFMVLGVFGSCPNNCIDSQHGQCLEEEEPTYCKCATGKKISNKSPKIISFKNLTRFESIIFKIYLVN